MKRKVETICRKCKATISLDFGSASYVDALAWIEKIDRSPNTCPGYHVEGGNWRIYWCLDEAVEIAYTEGEKMQSWYEPFKANLQVVEGSVIIKRVGRRELNDLVRDYLQVYANNRRAAGKSVNVSIRIIFMNFADMELSSVEESLEHILKW